VNFCAFTFVNIKVVETLNPVLFCFSVVNAGRGRKLRPTNRIHGANWYVGKYVFIIIYGTICTPRIMMSNAGMRPYNALTLITLPQLWH